MTVVAAAGFALGGAARVMFGTFKLAAVSVLNKITVINALTVMGAAVVAGAAV